MRRIAALVCTLMATALCLGTASAAAQVDQTCQLSLTRLEPNTSNTLLLDKDAVYWMVSYHVIPGARLLISGQFPHARYMSWNLYDAAARPADALPDFKVQPASGSVNPFVPGASRTSRQRRYTAYVDFTDRPAKPAANTMYAGQDANGQPNLAGTLWYRIYVPDRGRDIEGGVALPQISLELPGLGGLPVLPTAHVCSTFYAPNPPQLQEMFRGSNGLPLPDQTAAVGFPGRNPPNWHLFANFSLAFSEILLDNAYTDPFNAIAHGLPTSNPSNPGIFADKNDAYIYAATSHGFGNVLMIRARAPTFADTHDGARRMPSGEQVRFFSMCEYEPATMRVIDCARDDQTVLRHGSYTYVISTPADRPRNAVRRCGVTWIAQGPQPYGLLILRNLLSSPSFAHSTAKIGQPGREQTVMGAYYPRGRYFANAQAFQRRGCAGAARS